MSTKWECTRHDYKGEEPCPWCERPCSIGQAKWVMHKLYDHMMEGGTYRYLIYERLGFDESSYHELLDYGMALSNAFSDLEDLPKMLKMMAALRSISGMCDCIQRRDFHNPDPGDKEIDQIADIARAALERVEEEDNG